MEFNRGNLILGILCSKSTEGTERMNRAPGDNLAISTGGSHCETQCRRPRTGSSGTVNRSKGLLVGTGT